MYIEYSIILCHGNIRRDPEFGIYPTALTCRQDGTGFGKLVYKYTDSNTYSQPLSTRS